MIATPSNGTRSLRAITREPYCGVAEQSTRLARYTNDDSSRTASPA